MLLIYSLWERQKISGFLNFSEGIKSEIDQYASQSLREKFFIQSFSGPYFPTFGLNTGDLRSKSLYLVRTRENTD